VEINRVTKLFRFSFLLVFGPWNAAIASYVTSATATLGSNVCNNAGTISATCMFSAVVPGGTESVIASGLAGPGGPPGRFLESDVVATGPASGTAFSSYTGFLIVTGASGSGTLTAQFTGFADVENGASPVNVQVMIGGTTSSQTLSPLPGTTYNFTAPVTFGVLIPFSVSIADAATGIVFHDGTFGTQIADGILQSAPAFSVPGANVNVVPEPASGLLVLFGAVCYGARRTVQCEKRRSASQG
jgi:hypothetical protein